MSFYIYEICDFLQLNLFGILNIFACDLRHVGQRAFALEKSDVGGFFMMKKMSRLIAVLAMTFVCAGLFGCDYLENDDEPVLIGSGCQNDPGFVMVSDSTSLGPLHCYEHYENSLDDWKECRQMGLRLTHVISGDVYWEGKIDICPRTYDYFAYPMGSLNDSTILWVYSNNLEYFSYHVWKIGEDAVLKRSKWKNGYVSLGQTNVIMRNWKEGTILFKYYEKYALLDTAENTITQVTKEEAGWPDGVEDAQYFGNDLMTIVLYPNNFSYSIVRNGKDTISTYYEEAPNSYDVVRERFNGRYIIRMKTDAWYVFSTDGSWQISEKPVAIF